MACSYYINACIAFPHGCTDTGIWDIHGMCGHRVNDYTSKQASGFTRENQVEMSAVFTAIVYNAVLLSLL